MAVGLISESTQPQNKRFLNGFADRKEIEIIPYAHLTSMQTNLCSLLWDRRKKTIPFMSHKSW